MDTEDNLVGDLRNTLGFGCGSDPALGFGLVNLCFELELLVICCSLTPVFELNVAWEKVDEKIMFDLRLSVR